ncbi:hypothetical protein HMPREF2534_03967 [Bacteroides thetaiotaomicron]|nr:hypothetical protein HMPREF2534_03967 [Bacteroides thetaiotaomicron]
MGNSWKGGACESTPFSYLFPVGGCLPFSHGHPLLYKKATHTEWAAFSVI